MNTTAAAKPSEPLPPAHPRRPNRLLFMLSSLALAAWTVVLALIAWRVI